MFKTQFWQNVRRRTAALCSFVLATSAAFVVLAAEPAYADPACVNGGVYVLFARGSGEDFNAPRAHAFYWSLIGSAQNPGKLTQHHISTAWAELGNLNGDSDPQHNLDPGEYPAVAVPWSVANGEYDTSVHTGTDELVNHLNDRTSRCPFETIVLAGYSQGADVIGWALERNGGGGYVSLTQSAKNHISFVALYGDPKFNVACNEARWWVRGNPACLSYPRFTPRNPYLPNELQSRVGSWCDNGDGICAINPWTVGEGNHGSVYQDYWIQVSEMEITNSLGRRIIGSPSAISRSSTTMDVFYRGADNSLVSRWWDPNNGWQMQVLVPGNIDNSVYSSPVAISRGPTDIQVFWRNRLNQLVNKGFDPSGWGPEVVRASNVNGDPTAITRSSTNMDVFFMGDSSNLRNIGWNSTSSWGPVVTRATGVAGSPKAVARGATNMDVFFRGTNGNLMNIGWNSNGWGPVVSRGSNMTFDPAVVARTTGNMDVFYRQSNGNLARAYWGSSGWQWQSFATTMVGNPTAISRSPNTVDAFFRTAGGGLVNYGYDSNGSWNLTTRVSSGVLGDPGAVYRSTGHMEVLYSNGYGVGTAWFDPNSGWYNGALNP